MAGTLRTWGWTRLEGKPKCEELLIPIDNIIFIQRYDNDTCLVSISEKRALLVDLTLKEMRKILSDAKKHPEQDFDAHVFQDNDEEISEKSRKNKKNNSHNLP